MKEDEKKKVIKLILEKAPITEIIKKFSEEEKLKINLMNDLGFDSIRLISLVIEIEDMFDIEFSDDMLLSEYLSTPEQIIRNIEVIRNKSL